MNEAYTVHDFCAINEKERQTIPYLNELIEQGRAGDLILVGECQQERQLAEIADEIASRQEVKLVLLAGPSSSGKTTSTRRLAASLKARGKDAVTLSLDDFFLGVERYPLDADGNADYESLYCLDVERIRRCLWCNEYGSYPLHAHADN